MTKEIDYRTAIRVLRCCVSCSECVPMLGPNCANRSIFPESRAPGTLDPSVAESLSDIPADSKATYEPKDGRDIGEGRRY